MIFSRKLGQEKEMVILIHWFGLRHFSFFIFNCVFFLNFVAGVGVFFEFCVTASLSTRSIQEYITLLKDYTRVRGL